MFASRRIPHRPTGQAQRARCKVPQTAAGPLAGSGYLLTIQSTKPVLSARTNRAPGPWLNRAIDTQAYGRRQQ